MTEQYEWNHGSIPVERQAFMWTTTLLQVRDGAKWRKMTSSQAGRTLSPSSCLAVWSTAWVTLSNHLQQSFSTLKANSGTSREEKTNHWLNVTRQSLSHLLWTLNLQLRKRLIRVLNVTSHGPNCALFHPWLLPVNYLELSFYAEPLVN